MVPNVLVVQADSSSRSVPELIAQAKRAPGKFTWFQRQWHGSAPDRRAV